MQLQPNLLTPQHPLLQQHLQFYYFLSTETCEFETQYYAFPSENTVLNIHRHASCQIEDYYTRVYEDRRQPNLTILQGMRELPLRAHLQGRLDKVTVVFRPLGINQFLRVPFAQVGSRDSQVFSLWEDLPAYQQFLQEFYATSATKERAQLLENFLLSQYVPLPELEPLHQAVAWLQDFEQELPVEEIAQRVGLHPRTFHRLCTRHLGVSPIGFRKIARFRHSLRNKLVNTQFQKLTEVGYASNFYDQAYFNKIYKQFTGSNPTAFFNSVELLANDHLVFQFVPDAAV